MRIFSTVLVLALAVTLAAAQGPGKKICSVNMLFRDRFNVLYCGAIACMHLYLYYSKQSCYSDSCMPREDAIAFARVEYKIMCAL
jgi:hypothetical protein